MKKAISRRSLAAIAVLLLIAGILVYRHGHPRAAGSGPAGHSANTQAKRPAGPKTSSTGSASNNQDKSQSATAPVALTAPSGQFVSNHHVSLSANGANAQEASVCTDVPGATCQISFTKDGTTVSLSQKTTDNNGNAYWTWQASDFNLTPGSWQITATASLKGQTKTTTDPLALEVSQ